MIKFDPEIFEINRDFKVKLTEIGNEKNRLIEIENFLLYPDSVREFLLSIPAFDATTKKIPKLAFFPGYQTYLNYEIKCMYDFFGEALSESFGYKLDTALLFAYQVIDGNKSVYAQSNLPHADQCYFAANLFLNHEHEIGEGAGTAFYRSKHTGNETATERKSMYRVLRDFGHKPTDLNMTKISTVLENEDWERYYLSEQKFNKMNLYEGCLFHTSFVKAGTFTEFPRITFTINDMVL